MKTINAVLAWLLLFSLPVHADTTQWTPAKAQTWYAQHRWLVGSDYIPADAINQLEMWQADTFDPAQIDKELGWAESLGMNTMRVFLLDKLWEQYAAGFNKSIDMLLATDARPIGKTLPVVFTLC